MAEDLVLQQGGTLLDLLEGMLLIRGKLLLVIVEVVSALLVEWMAVVLVKLKENRVLVLPLSPPSLPPRHEP